MSTENSGLYRPGDRVRVRRDSPDGHHRTPGYVKGKAGWVVSVCGAFLNPESLAHGGSGTPKQPLYRVEFQQVELWDSYSGSPRDKSHVDIYEHWLEPA